MRVFRRIMLAGGIDIDALPDTHKLYYKATAKVSPNTGSLGVTVIANKYNVITGEGIIVCNHAINTIKDYAFSDKTALTSITIPNNITSIGNFIFNGCTGELKINCNLPDITYSNNVYSGPLQNSRFTKIIIGHDVMQFGSAAFRECTSIAEVHVEDIKDLLKIDFKTLSSTPMHPYGGSSGSSNKKLYVNGELYTDLIIPDDITSIKKYTFAGCGSLTNAIIPNNITSLEMYAFFNCRNLTNVIISDGISIISSNAFSNCTSLRNLTIGNHVIEIQGYAFEKCTSLTTFIIPNSVTSIGYGAFSNCISLTSVTIPDSVTEIGESAFENCSGRLTINSKIIETDYTSDNYPSNKWLYKYKFTELILGDNIEKIGSYTFYYCTMTSVTIPDSVTEIGESAFSNCKSLTSVTIPNDVTSIGKSAFYDCRSLVNITIPDSVTSIEKWTFYHCTSLTSVIIGNGVTSIGESVFSNCDSLTSVTIGNGVTSMGNYAFGACISMQYYDFSTHESVPTLKDTSVFYNIPSTCKIIVPDTLYNEWIAATNWSAYADNIIKKSDWDASQVTE